MTAPTTEQIQQTLSDAGISNKHSAAIAKAISSNENSGDARPPELYSSEYYLNQRIDKFEDVVLEKFKDVDRRFKEAKENTDRRFDEMDRRFEEAKENTDRRFDEMDRRFDLLEEKIKALPSQTFLGLMTLLVAAAIVLAQNFDKVFP